MYEDRFNLDDIFTLDFLDLRLSTFADLEPHEKLKGRIEFISSHCSSFINKGGIGLCNKKEVICPAWECEIIKICGEECIHNCLVSDPKAIFYSKIPPEIESAIHILDNKIEEIMKKIPKDAILSWFSNRAEEGAQIALTQSPYEIIASIRIWQWLYESYGKLDLIKITRNDYSTYEKQLNTIWRSILARYDLEFSLTKIRNGDSVLALSETGKQLLKRLNKNPTSFYDLWESELNKAFKRKQMPEPGHFKQTLWTTQMEPVIRWCIINTFPIDLARMSIGNQFNRMIEEHSQSNSKGEALPPTESVRLSLPLYGALFYMSRYAALKFPFFREVIEDYLWLPDILEEKLGLILDHRLWDKTLLKLHYSPELKAKAKLLGLKNAQSDRWPISNDSDLMLANILLLGFAAKNKLHILAKNFEAGKWFEDIIEKELTDRSIPIVSRNLQIPNGEIDFLCFDSTCYYVIEAKDYGPRGKDEYFSSKEYKDRNKDLEDYLNKFKNRLSWIKNNPESLEIPKDTEILGVFVSSCEEPHIKLPQGIIAATNRRLCSIFGGEPIDPMVKMKALRANLPRTKDVTYKKRKGRIPPSKVRPYSPSKQINTLFKFAHRRINSIFGDSISFQLYRIAWEICKAFSENGASVMELCAESYNRPHKVTKQYLFFVAHRADNLPLSDIKEAFRNLLDRDLLIEHKSEVRLGTSVPSEYWKFKNNKWYQTDSDEDADITLFDSRIKKDKKLGKVAGFVDAIVGPKKEMVLFKIIQ